MKVIITGATGFIGRNIAEALHADGHTVITTGRTLAPDTTLPDFRPADLLDLADVFEPAEVVIHCAALAGDWGHYSDFHRANVLGTRSVIENLEHHDIPRILFLSTPSIYYSGEHRLDIRESDPLPPFQTTHYSRTKLEAEQDIRALPQHMIFRPRAVFGPHDRIIIPRIIQMASKRRFPLIAGGEAIIDITHVDNLVHAVRLALEAPDNAWNETYNISNGDPLPLRTLFERILAAKDLPFRPRTIPLPVATTVATLNETLTHLPFGPKTPAFTRFSVGYMARSMTLNIDKARDLLGYTPVLDNDQSLEKLGDTKGVPRTPEEPTKSASRRV
jgi:nucleoside-diphosphate-sugar epimerase